MRLDLMHSVADRVDQRGYICGGKLGPFTRCEHQLGTVEVKPGRSAFIGLDMRFLMTNHAAVRRDHRAQRPAVGGCSRRHPPGGARAAEQIAEKIVKRRAETVALLGHNAMVGGWKRLPSRIANED